MRQQFRDAPGGVLFVPRNSSHLRMSLPVASEMRKACAAHWLVFKLEHWRALLRLGERAVLAQPLVSAAACGTRRAVAALRHDAETLLALPLLAQSFGGSPAAAEAILRRTLAQNLGRAALAAVSIERTLDAVRPRVVVVGNPNTMEGRIAASLARLAGVPSATIQHGDIAAGDPSWRSAEVNRIFVWGDGARRVLVSMGIDGERVEIAGHPALVADVPPAPAQSARSERTRMVLVALSGAGHMVGMAEHLNHVERLAAAAMETPELKWVFRLHPKDSPGIYTAAFARANLRNAAIVLARKAAQDMTLQLRECGVLVTVTSTSAVDAMVARVPVVTLARAAGEHVPAFVRAGAVVQVGPAESVALVVREVLLRGQPRAVGRQVDAYVSEHIGPRDGLAARRVADRLCSMMTGGE